MGDVPWLEALLEGGTSVATPLNSEVSFSLVDSISRLARDCLRDVTDRDAAIAALVGPSNIFSQAFTSVLSEWNFQRASIHRLPIEILAHCWAHLVDIEDKVMASRVCTKWHRIIFDTPGIWTSLSIGQHPSSNLRCLPLFLDRTKGRPVDLTAGIRSSTDAVIFMKCMDQHLSHIRHLHIAVTHLPFRAENLLTQYLHRVPAPMLESLHWDMDLGEFPFFYSLFGDHCPHLRTVGVGRAYLDGAPPLTFRNLARFEVHAPTAAGEIQTFHQLLESLPYLSELRVHHIQHPRFLPSAPAYLPRLREVALHMQLSCTPDYWFWQSMYDLGWTALPNVTLENRSLQPASLAFLTYARKGVHSLKIYPSRALAMKLTAESRAERSHPPMSSGSALTHILSHDFRTLCTLTLHGDLTEENVAVSETGAPVLQHALFPFNDLPRLITLAILFGAPRAGEWSLFHPLILHQCPLLRAPALQTLRIACVPDAADVLVRSICPREVAFFVSHHLTCEPLPLLVVDGVPFRDEQDGGTGLDVLLSHVTEVQCAELARWDHCSVPQA